MTWLLIGGAGYLGYNVYQKTQTDADKAADALSNAEAKKDELSAKVTDLTHQVSALETQLAEEHNRLPTFQSAAAPVTVGTGLTPTSIPATLTTLSGKTYLNCVLSRVTPDGISFTHTYGVAKVPFSDLDSAFAATFGYDPVAARKYEQDQAAQAAQSDALRNIAEAPPANSAPPSIVALATPSPSPAPPPATNNAAAQKAAVQAQIAAKEGQITGLQQEAQNLDAGERAKFNSIYNIYYNAQGQLEHRSTMGHSQEADDDRAKIEDLQEQIARLQVAL
jgi:hypothetical protein